MGDSTGISWADATFNPWIGCSKVSQGCKFCYAEELVTGRMGEQNAWGPRGVRRRTAPGNWAKPLRWERLATEGKLPDGTENRDGHRPRIFCASLADVFEDRRELDPWRHDLMRLIFQTPHLDWMLLTKRPDVARDWLKGFYDRCWVSFVKNPEAWEDMVWATRDGVDGFGVLPNIWLGTSIESARATWRADVLREIPANIRFLSCEPLIGSLFLPPNPRGGSTNETTDAPPRAPEPDRPDTAAADGGQGGGGSSRQSVPPDPRPAAPLDLTGIDWVIAGGESGGRNARPLHPAWARELRDAVMAEGYGCCGDPGVECCGRPLDTGECCGTPVPASGCCGEWEQRDRPAFHFKQWGSWAEASIGNVDRAQEHRFLFPDGRVAVGADEERAREVAHMVYLGAKPASGGKHLDGADWCEFPESPLARVLA